MSEILTIQRRLVEVGRVRLGEKKTSANGKTYPARLTKFRLTSRDKARLDAAAVLYGGEVRQWDTQWELYTDTDVLPVAVVPGQALSQSFELWGQKPLPGGKKTGVICLRRCDGETEHLTGQACICSANDEQTCKPTTRLSVVLTEVPGIGVWRVEAHGWNAASELTGGVRLLESLVATGRPVRARLRLDFRTQVTEDETRQFVVPVIDIDHTLGQVLDAVGPARPVAEIGTGFQPVPASLPSAPVGTIAQQVAAPPPTRRTSTPPIPATGVQPRTTEEATAGPVCAECGGSLIGYSVTIKPGVGRVHKDGCPSAAAPNVVELVDLGNATDAQADAKRFAMDARRAFDSAYQAAPKGDKTRVVDRLRHALVYCVSAGRTVHYTDLTVEQQTDAHGRIGDLLRGQMTYEVIPDGIVFLLDEREIVVPLTELEPA